MALLGLDRAKEIINRSGQFNVQQKQLINEALAALDAPSGFDPDLLVLDVGVFGESTNVRLAYDGAVATSFGIGDLVSATPGSLQLDNGLLYVPVIVSADANNSITEGNDGGAFYDAP